MPPDRVFVQWCPDCGQIGAAAVRSDKVSIVGIVCPQCDYRDDTGAPPMMNIVAFDRHGRAGKVSRKAGAK
jgi:hypothetical protein